jgi:hypothetical protein
MNPIANVALLKEASHPEVYFVLGGFDGFKFWIPSPEEFQAHGFDWGKVQTVPDGTLDSIVSVPFSIKPQVKPSDVFFTGGDPHNYQYNLKDPASIIAKNVLLAGWLVEIYDNCLSGRLCIEDFHYKLIVDPDFIARMYGNGGLSSLLNGVTLPGNPPQPNNPMPFDDVSESDGSSRGVTINSFTLPGDNDWSSTEIPFPRVMVEGELNCWHVNDTHRGGPFGWAYNWKGRGKAPDGWIQQEYELADPDAIEAQSWWPFVPSNPDGGGRDLAVGDYVILRGTLWQDVYHNHGPTPWEQGPTQGHGGWIELHPVDWLQRVPVTLLPQTAVTIAICDTQSQSRDFNIKPDFKQFTTLDVLDVRELIDGRFTVMGTVYQHYASNLGDHVHIGVTTENMSPQQSRFKAVYVVTWEPSPIALCISGTEFLHLFTRSLDGSLLYKRFDPKSGIWTDWQNGGEHFLFGPAAAAWARNLVYYFACGLDYALYYKWLSWASGTLPPPLDPTTAWSRLNATCTSTPAICMSGSIMHIFIRDKNNDILYNWFDTANADSDFAGWHFCGGGATSGPTTAAWTSNLVYYFVRGTDNALYYKWLSWVPGNPPPVPDPTEPWHRLDGIFASSPAACVTGSVMHLFVRGRDGDILYNYLDAAGTRGDWVGWQSLGSPTHLSSPTAVAWGPNHVYVFVRGYDHYIYYKWFDAVPGGTPVIPGPDAPWTGMGLS